MEEDVGTLGAQRLSREESQDEVEGGSTKTNNVWKSLTETLSQKANSKIKLKRKEFQQWYPVWMDNVAPRRYGLLKEKPSENAHWDRIPPQTLSLCDFIWPRALRIILTRRVPTALRFGWRRSILLPDCTWVCFFIQQLWDIWLPLWFCLFKQYVYFFWGGHMGFACIFLCALHAYSDLGSQKRALYPLKLELQTAGKSHVGGRIQTQGLWKSDRCSKPQSHLSSSGFCCVF